MTAAGGHSAAAAPRRGGRLVSGWLVVDVSDVRDFDIDPDLVLGDEVVPAHVTFSAHAVPRVQSPHILCIQGHVEPCSLRCIISLRSLTI